MDGVIPIPARLKHAGIQRRLDICLAVEADPDLTYRQIQQRFKASSTIVAAALKNGKEVWAAMLGQPRVSQSHAYPLQVHSMAQQQGGTGKTPLKYLAITVEPLAGRGDPAPFRFRAAGQEWQQVETPGIDGLLTDLAAKGWELVYMARTGIGRGAVAFDGTYECIFKSTP
ncbi:MAG: hypothetical protein GYA24_25655 [Candidatus Lokiarchaeota archaeon]|nr:hypothetical protein [Candidatus Lokiarchaeota archaeon]